MFNDLLSTIIKVNESTKDLFPGIDSSAFDEHAASKAAGPTVDKISNQIERVEHQRNNAVLQQRRLHKIFHRSYGHQAANTPTEEMLIDVPWIDKYPLTKKRLPNSRVETAGPRGERIEQVISSYESALEQEERCDAKLKTLKGRLTRVRKKESTQGIDDRAAKTPKTVLDPKNIPTSFKIGWRTVGQPIPRMSPDTPSNPYHIADARGKYAGHPVHYPDWQGKDRTMYYDIDRWAKRLGHPPMDIMYASTPRRDRFDYRKQGRLRFFLKNSDNSVIVYNDPSYRIFVYAKADKYPGNPMRYRMRRLRKTDLDWLYDKLTE